MQHHNARILYALNEIKAEPVNGAVLAGSSMQDLVKACKAWSMCSATISSEIFEETGDLWESVQIDLDMFRRIAGIIEPGTLESLVLGNVVYPDGTYNVEFLMQLEGAHENHKRKDN